MRRVVTVATRDFGVMGTEAELVVSGPDAETLADRAVARLRALEARWSRFLPDSEVSRCNAHPGAAVLVSPETYRLVELALEGRRVTGGRFDPTMLAELRAVGYDRSFEQLAPPRVGAAAVAPVPDGAPVPEGVPRRGAVTDVVLDPIVGTVTLLGGATFDPGGIGKGVAADLVAEELRATGATGVMVSLGGDVRVDGRPPDGQSWVIAVADPLAGDDERARLFLEAGAVASSWRTKRVFTGPDGTIRHHLLDPRTGAPAASGLAGVTVVTGQAWMAEVLAKAAFVAGPDDGVEVIAASGAAGLLFTDAGDIVPAGGIGAFLG